MSIRLSNGSAAAPANGDVNRQENGVATMRGYLSEWRPDELEEFVVELASYREETSQACNNSFPPQLAEEDLSARSAFKDEVDNALEEEENNKTKAVDTGNAQILRRSFSVGFCSWR
eukprot:scaffold434_cov186-Pinguiococcus_pyrenoidosus.AAC.32